MSLNKRRMRSIASSKSKYPVNESLSTKVSLSSYEKYQLELMFEILNKDATNRKLFNHYLLSYIEINGLPLPHAFEQNDKKNYIGRNVEFETRITSTNILFLHFQILIRLKKEYKGILHEHILYLSRAMSEPKRAAREVFDVLLVGYKL